MDSATSVRVCEFERERKPVFHASTFMESLEYCLQQAEVLIQITPKKLTVNCVIRLFEALFYFSACSPPDLGHYVPENNSYCLFNCEAPDG